MKTTFNTNILKSPVFLMMLLGVFAIASTGSTTSNEVPKGAFQFDLLEIDYGTIHKGANGERSFAFVNTGEAPIVITNIKTSCGCTVPTKPKGPIMPGERAEIGVQYNTNRVGAFSKSITVMSNAKELLKVLKIKGMVVDSENKLGK